MARNPFRSEAEAYRFLLLTVGYFALIVAAATIRTWLGLVVFVALKAAGVRERVLVVCPALNSPVRTWVSDEDPARAAAQRRLHASLAQLARDGIDAAGEV